MSKAKTPQQALDAVIERGIPAAGKQYTYKPGEGESLVEAVSNAIDAAKLDKLKAEGEKAAIDRAKESLTKGLEKITGEAMTAEAFRKKYGRKQFNSLTVGKSVILNYLYMNYQLIEKVPAEEITALYDREKLRQKIETTQHYIYYSYYLTLLDWITAGYEAAVNMKTALRTQGNALLSMITGIISAEHIRKGTGETEDQLLRLHIQTLSLDEYAPQGEYSADYTSLRESYCMSLRYLKAYNLFFDLMAEAQGIPELAIFKMNMESAENQRERINEALKTLRETAEEIRGATLEEREPGEPLGKYHPNWSRGYLDSVLELFSAIPEAEELPEENVENTREEVRTPPHFHVSWQGVFDRILTKDYWRRGI